MLQTNSISKHIMSDTRKQMDPTSFEMLLILKLNPDLWHKRSVNAVIKQSTPRRTERDQFYTDFSGTVSSSSSLTAKSFFSTSGNRQQRSQCDDNDNEENDEDDKNDWLFECVFWWSHYVFKRRFLIFKRCNWGFKRCTITAKKRLLGNALYSDSAHAQLSRSSY